jgi:hypothetical protein
VTALVNGWALPAKSVFISAQVKQRFSFLLLSLKLFPFYIFLIHPIAPQVHYEAQSSLFSLARNQKKA